MKNLKIKKAIVSLYEKKDLDFLVPYFKKFNIEVFSTGGTYEYIKKLDIDIKLTEISKLTNFPEILDGRVKTLHPKIHSGILADMSNENHVTELNKINVSSFDLVIVNFYPFEKEINKKKNSFADCIESIDIGGPTMLRAAAKNFLNTVVLSSSLQIKLFIDLSNRNDNSIDYETRKKLAGEAFQTSAYYESIIAQWFTKMTKLLNVNETSLPLKKLNNLRYGENPHQMASIFKLSNNELNQISGKEISYNNMIDIDSAVELALELDQNSCVIVKHGNPCGVAISTKQYKSYKKALESDPVSAFGGIVAFNTELSIKTASLIKKIFTEIVIAPKISDEVKKYLSLKKNLILIEYNPKDKNKYYQYRSTKNFLLMQDQNTSKLSRENLKFVTKKKPNKKQIKDCLFAFSVCKYVNSNAIVIAKNNQTIGIGVGQTNRLESTKQAISKLKALNYERTEVILASDGFFPFPDIIKLCNKNNIRTIIQPGGSLNDEKIINQANKNGIKMIFTGIRNFKH